MSASVSPRWRVMTKFSRTCSRAAAPRRRQSSGSARSWRARKAAPSTEFTVNSVEGAAFRARQLLADPELGRRLGAAGREHVRENFVITRHLGDVLALMATLLA